jgi:hypothetical protein
MGTHSAAPEAGTSGHGKIDGSTTSLAQAGLTTRITVPAATITLSGMFPHVRERQCCACCGSHYLDISMLHLCGECRRWRVVGQHLLAAQRALLGAP